MKKQPLTPGAERLLKARKAAAKELELPVGNPFVQRFAILKMAFDAVQVRVASGAEIDVDHLLKLESAMQEIRAAKPQKPQTVTLKIVGGKPMKDRVCRACGVEHHIEPVCTACGFRQNGDTAVENRHRWYMGEGFAGNAHQRARQGDCAGFYRARANSGSTGSAAATAAPQSRQHSRRSRRTHGTVTVAWSYRWRPQRRQRRPFGPGVQNDPNPFK